MNETSEKLIRELAEKLGTTAEHLWPFLVRQAVISGFIDLLSLAVVMLSAWWVFQYVKNAQKDPKNEFEDFTMAWVFLGIVAAIMFVFVSMLGCDAITRIANPEYWALKQILR